MIGRAGLHIPGISLVRRGTIVGLLALWIAVAAGCAPVEVRVVDGPSEATAVEEQEAQDEGGATVDPLIEGLLTTIVAYLVVFAEICGAFVIAVAVVQALLQFFRFLSHREQNEYIKDDIRLRLGRSLASALEFALAADILKTAVAPTWGSSRSSPQLLCYGPRLSTSWSVRSVMSRNGAQDSTLTSARATPDARHLSAVATNVLEPVVRRAGLRSYQPYHAGWRRRPR